ncbi:hypothetical protein [Spiroplasma taiwanense]|uniref:Uncharacterized protein n=1 Tax=Spiroplasma taiwanense CT-1 TaxID=1276220 RepID=S5MH46_9MOLU|nr:hypothetical protein [Spiroplasma taiwanense]AGR41160.1 hypothetical protein STAIW_v1c05330 [Spiroplasma taiwanense CT-1]
MYYVFWRENSFYVIDKDMNVVNRFFSMDEAQQLCFYLNYNNRIYNNNFYETPAIFTKTTNSSGFPKQREELTKLNTTFSNEPKNVFSSLTPGVSYGNITINIPQHESYSHKREEPVENIFTNDFVVKPKKQKVIDKSLYEDDQSIEDDLEFTKIRKKIELEKLKKQLELEKTATNLELEKFKKELEFNQTSNNLELEKTKKQLELEQMRKQLELEQNASNLNAQKINNNLELEKLSKELELERANKQIELERMAKELELERANKGNVNNENDSSFISANEINNFIKKLEE